MQELSRAEWDRAEAIARELAADVDRNELGKVVTYALRVKDVDKVMTLVERLPRSGYVRSGRTRGYLQRIGAALRQGLAGLPGERAMLVLAWSFRLMTWQQTQRGGRR
jgi:hypothetical protein